MGDDGKWRNSAGPRRDEKKILAKFFALMHERRKSRSIATVTKSLQDQFHFYIAAELRLCFIIYVKLVVRV